MRRLISFLAATLLVAACRPAAEPEATGDGPQSAPASSTHTGANPLRDAYFGDLHIHTKYSHDAFIVGVRATPDDAYRYAKGEAIPHVLGYDIQLQGGPLDFTAVTDHALYLGVFDHLVNGESELANEPFVKQLRDATTTEERIAAFQATRPLMRSAEGSKLRDLGVIRSAWQEIIAAAERHNDPGTFTTFVAFEYTSSPNSQNLHRNVIFRGTQAPDLPFSRIESDNPEDLWDWLDAARAEGMEALAIPHNSNGSNGQMFKLETFDGQPLDAAYAETRMRNEPLVEVTQVKGTSETHPVLSPNDEWADFEIAPYRVATTMISDVPGSYVREAYRNGLELEASQGFNPFRFGLVGASDSHNAGGPVDESTYFGKVGMLDGSAHMRNSARLPGEKQSGDEFAANMRLDLFSAAGLTGIWAEENSRESLYDGLRRKETFATTGPRIRVRFFAGYDYPDDLATARDAIEQAYDQGVPMGGDLDERGDATPRFLVWASRDPGSAPLQRLQIIKGWVEDGDSQERVYDVACSDALQPDPRTHRCPDNGAAVDLSDCSFSSDVGASELSALWDDPDFEPGERAFYYARVLENPTCRWSTWDAIRAGVEPREDLHETIQERAFTSPIWLRPQ